MKLITQCGLELVKSGRTLRSCVGVRYVQLSWESKRAAMQIFGLHVSMCRG